jgi:alpha-D-ribose 1-methylphosphonate 5-triphosphate synthase subunit PhnI
MYVAVKGGEKAIDNAHRLLAEERRGNPNIPELNLSQIDEQLGLAVDRVMTEGSLYDRKLGALAIKQAQGDLVEAVFLLRAYRTTLPRFGYSNPIDTESMFIRRRVSATFKDVPGGQVLGPTFDYTHRLLDFSLADPEHGNEVSPGEPASEPLESTMSPITDILGREGLIREEARGNQDHPIGDLTREPLQLPAKRDMRLQNLVRGDEGFLLSVAYSLQRGFGANRHPFLGEIRLGEVVVEFVPPELGFPIEIGEITVTECIMLERFDGSSTIPPQFMQGYGLTFGHCERKAMAMAMVDRSLCCREMGATAHHPAQDEEFVLSHSDNVEASGFVQHLKLPHYVDFQSELVLIRRLQREYEARAVKDPIKDERNEDENGAQVA